MNLRKYINAFFLGCAVISTSVMAADAAKPPSGSVTINETQFALIVGGSTGGGVLTYKGKQYPFKITGISLGANIGVSKLSAVGEVYDLNDISKFAGTFTKLEIEENPRITNINAYIYSCVVFSNSGTAGTSSVTRVATRVAPRTYQ